MSIRDIIKAATPGEWDQIPHQANFSGLAIRTLVMPPEGMEPIAVVDGDNHRADARFIAAFDPEHGALMDAVCEVVREDHQEFGSHNTPHTPPWEECVVCTALDRLTAYRKERGL